MGKHLWARRLRVGEAVGEGPVLWSLREGTGKPGEHT